MIDQTLHLNEPGFLRIDFFMTAIRPIDDVIGLPIDELETPALLLDRAALNQNLTTMADYFRDRSANLRPHFKNHKCTQLARLQLEAGSAVGMTCAKLGEAEILAAAGIENILIANQVVGRSKMERLTQVARRARLSLAVDHVDQIQAISEAAVRADVQIGVLVEVDIGMGRCGVAFGEPALQLTRYVMDSPGIVFDGLQAFEGHLIYIQDANERRERTIAAMHRAIKTRQLIEAAGISVNVISGGSSSTYQFISDLPGVDEIQAGTYATMDCAYRKVSPEFQQALSVLTRVISRRSPGTAVLDVGVKGAGNEFGLPEIKGYPDLVIPFFKSEEHCVVNETPDWMIGQTVELIPSHACTTCNLYRQFHVHEDGQIVDVWPIEASGMLT